MHRGPIRVTLVIAALFLSLVGTTYVAVARQDGKVGAGPTYKRASPKTLEAYVVLLRLRHDLFLKWKETGKWPDDKEANAALAGHGTYWQKRLSEGTALLAGGMKGDYWDNVALIVFEAESEAKAKAIVQDDPAVKAYVFQAQVRPFDVSFLSDKYTSKH